MSADAIDPPHYRSHPSGVECIQITEHMNFNLGNAVKYVWRAGLKSASAVEDLMKARWYLEREIARLVVPASIVTTAQDAVNLNISAAEADQLAYNEGTGLYEPATILK